VLAGLDVVDDALATGDAGSLTAMAPSIAPPIGISARAIGVGTMTAEERRNTCCASSHGMWDGRT
jgi:hypothetical protein